MPSFLGIFPAVWLLGSTYSSRFTRRGVHHSGVQCMVIISYCLNMLPQYEMSKIVRIRDATYFRWIRSTYLRGQQFVFSFWCGKVIDTIPCQGRTWGNCPANSWILAANQATRAKDHASRTIWYHGSFWRASKEGGGTARRVGGVHFNGATPKSSILWYDFVF